MSIFRRDLEDFMLYCELTKQYSENTVRNYRNTLARFATYLDLMKVEQTNMIDLDIINGYRQYLHKKTTLRKDKMSLKAQAYQIVVVRSFLKFMIKNGALVLNPENIELPKTRMRRIEFLTDPEIQNLLSLIIKDTSKTLDVIKKRNQALILSMFGSGLRLSEVLNLSKKEIDHPDAQLIIQGKGGKIRTTFLAPSAIESIKEYLQVRGEDKNPFLFISFSKNNPKKPKIYKSLTPRMVQLMIQSYANQLGIYKKITPHTLRHSFATKILFAGGDLRSVQTLLGHSSISTTQIYTHITDWQIKDLHKKVFGSKNEPPK
ncbi:MAG: tyrosine-type recombinase/integrase [bacterium]